MLSLNNPTSDLFTFAGTNITLSDFRVLTPYATSTHGGLFNFTSASFIRLDRITTNGGFGVVQFLGSAGNLSYRTTITNCHFDNVMGNAVFYDQYFGGLGIISDTKIKSPDPQYRRQRHHHRGRRYIHLQQRQYPGLPLRHQRDYRNPAASTTPASFTPPTFFATAAASQARRMDGCFRGAPEAPTSRAYA